MKVKSTEMTLPDKLTPQQAAVFLNVHPSSVQRFIGEGKLKTTCFYNRHLIDLNELVAFKAGYQKNKPTVKKVRKSA